MIVDLQRIIDLVAVRHGFHLSKDDPVLATVTLAEEIWLDAARQLEERLSQVLEEAGMRWSLELRGAAGVLDGLTGKTEETLRDGLQLVGQAVRDDMAEISQTIHAEIAGSIRASTEGLNQSLSRLLSEVRLAADQAVQARRGAMIAAVVAGCMTCGGMLVLFAPLLKRLFWP